MSDRNSEIVAAHQSGATLREIGRRFDIGAERVRQIVLAAHRAEQKSSVADAAMQAGGVRAIPIDCAGLSARASRALRSDGIDTIGDVADRLAYIGSAATFIPNLGVCSVAEICAMLASHGLNRPVPKLSKAALTALVDLRISEDREIAQAFGGDGPVDARYRNRARHRSLTYRTMQELRSVATSLKDVSF